MPDQRQHTQDCHESEWCSAGQQSQDHADQRQVRDLVDEEQPLETLQLESTDRGHDKKH